MRKISTPKEHRELLLQAMQNLCDGRLDPQEAQALVGLSGQVHESIAQEWEMRVYAHERLGGGADITTGMLTHEKA